MNERPYNETEVLLGLNRPKRRRRISWKAVEDNFVGHRVKVVLRNGDKVSGKLVSVNRVSISFAGRICTSSPASNTICKPGKRRIQKIRIRSIENKYFKESTTAR